MPFWPTSVSISPTSKPLVTTILVSVSEERCFKWLAEIITWIVLSLLLLKSFIHLPIHPVGQKTFLHQVMSTGLSHRDLKTNETRSRAWNSTVFKRNNRHRAFHARGRARWQWDGGGEEGAFNAAWRGGDMRAAVSQCGWGRWFQAEGTQRQEVVKCQEI